MKILERSKNPDGIRIQLEDWREHNTPEFPNLYGLTIGAYPTAQRTSKYKWVKGGETFRLSIPQSEYWGYANEDVKADYEALKTGKKKLEDLAEHFYNGERDMWYLGMDYNTKGKFIGVDNRY